MRTFTLANGEVLDLDELERASAESGAAVEARRKEIAEERARKEREIRRRRKQAREARTQ